MTTTSTDDKVADKAADRSMLDPDEADRFAALIKPAWEDEEAVQAVSTATPATPSRSSDEGRPTAIDPIPNVDVGDTLPIDNPPIIDAEALVASVESPPKSKGAPPSPSARPGSTRMGLGSDVEVAAAAAHAAHADKASGKTQLGIGDASELAAAGAATIAAAAVEPDEDLIATQARPVASVPPVAQSAPPQPPRPAAGAAMPRVSAAARVSDDDPISLPMNRGTGGGSKMGVGIGIGLAIAAVAGLGIFLLSGNKEPPKPPVATAAAPKAEAKAPEIKPPPLIPDTPAKSEPTPAETAKPEPAKADEPKAEPAKADEPKADPPKSDPPKSDPPKPPAGGSKPPAGGTKPPAGGTKPKGGIIRDAPF